MKVIFEFISTTYIVLYLNRINLLRWLRIFGFFPLRDWLTCWFLRNLFLSWNLWKLSQNYVLRTKHFTILKLKLMVGTESSDVWLPKKWGLSSKFIYAYEHCRFVIKATQSSKSSLLPAVRPWMYKLKIWLILLVKRYAAHENLRNSLKQIFKKMKTIHLM